MKSAASLQRVFLCKLRKLVCNRYKIRWILCLLRLYRPPAKIASKDTYYEKMFKPSIHISLHLFQLRIAQSIGLNQNIPPTKS